MRKNWLSMVAGVALAVCLAGLQPAAAAEPDYEVAPPSAAAMGVDMLLMRPVGLAATVVGTGLFVVSLPFSALGMNTGDAANRLVAEPAKFTFARPLGDFQSTTPTAAAQR